MYKIYDNKYDPIKNFLFFLFSIDDIYKHKEKIMENVQILVDEQELKKEISRQWIYLLGKSENFDNLVDEFIEKRYIEWNKKLETFQNIKNESEIKIFIEKNFPLSMLIRYETNSLSRNDILRFLEFKEPKIKDFYQGRHGKYLNFLIYADNLLYINLHLKLKEYTTGTYGLLILISFWIEESEFFDAIDLRVINENYGSSILCYKILNKLLSLGFKKLSLFEVSEYWKDKYYPNISNEWAKSLPHLFITEGMEIINENPVFLFEELASKLNQIDLVINNHEKSPIMNPNDWYNSLSIEVQTFMEKGKELFLKIEKKYQKIEKEKITENGKIKEPKENELTIEAVILLFKDILQKDKQNENVNKESKGFRTINSFFKECENNLKGKSIQTLYNYFKQWKDLDYYLESRESKRQGGGKEYRYKEGLFSQKILTGKQFIESEEQKAELFQKEKIQIQQALNYYNNQKYEKAKILLIKISKSPSKDLIKNNQLYYGIFYYIGRCYQKLKDYSNATNYFKKIYSENKDFINVNFHYIKRGLEAGMYTETFEIIDSTIDKIKENLKIFDLSNYYTIYDDLEFILRSFNSKAYLTNDGLRPFIEYLQNNTFIDKFIDINKIKPDLKILQSTSDDNDNVKIYYNLLLTKKFYETLIKLWFLKTECFRRYIYDCIINKKTKILEEIIDNFIYFAKEIQQLNSKTKFPFIDVLSYIYYFIGLVKLSNLLPTQKKLERYFPEGTKLNFAPEFPLLKKLNNIYYYLNAVNQCFNSPKKIFHIEVKSFWDKKSISIPSNIAVEFNFIKIKLMEKILLEELLNEEKSSFLRIKNSNIEDIYELYQPWNDFHFSYQSYRNLSSYLEILSEFRDLCNKNKIEKYNTHINNLQNILDNKLKEVKEIRLKGRTSALNSIFKILSSKYKKKDYEFDIITKNNSEDWSLDTYINHTIRTEIHSIVQNKVGSIKANLDIKDRELLKHIFKSPKGYRIYIGEKLDLDFSLWLEPKLYFEENKNFLKFNYKIYLTYKKERYEEGLDIIILALFQTIDLNADALVIQIVDKFKKEFENYFQEQFPKEYQNEFFEFIPKFFPNKRVIKIKIRKKM